MRTYPIEVTSNSINAHGHEEALNNKILVTGVARNCAKTIKKDYSRIATALGSFPNVQWLIIESDSSDGTVTKLKELEAMNNHFRYITLGNLYKDIPLRTERIAYCRNSYINEINTNPEYINLDYVIVADFDGINDSITETGIISCWIRQDWDVCTANQKGPYYDIWALRHPSWSPNDCWAQYKFFIDNKVNPEKSLFSAIHSRMIVISEHTNWIEVDSSFGGFAIYRKICLQGATYSGINADGGEICEHVTLHQQIKSHGYKIFINPQLINAKFTEHTKTLRPLHNSYRKAKNIIKSILYKIKAV